MADSTLRIAVAQLNSVLGDIDGNLALAREALKTAAGQRADVLVFSELFISGYPPEDLVLKSAFTESCRRAVEELATDVTADGPAVLIGTPWVEDGSLYNAVAHLDKGAVKGLRFKVALPNYGVFDEMRVFASGPLPGPLSVRGVRIGVPICEDIWVEDVVECLAETGAEILVVPNGSPYEREKADTRMQVAVARVVESGLPLVYVNQLGGQDELVFDGASFGLNADRSLGFQLAQFDPVIATVEWTREGEDWRCAADAPKHALPGIDEADWRACVLGLKDYVDKNGFPGVVLGLSGGIDSAICAAMAVDALGAERVHAIMLPYRYTSGESIADAAEVAEALGLRYDTVPIATAVEGVGAALEPLFAGREPDVTEENIQSRVRGTILMAVSNKFGAMVVTTGNKSEVSVGYSTLYGDMNGGFNPIKDLYKTEVYRLSRWRNTHRPEGVLGPEGAVMPDRVITKAPTAELRENQTDQDSLPPYEELDAILAGLVEEDLGVAAIVARGFDADVVRRIERLLYIAEYKRRQAAPGVKIGRRNFGRDRRYPITNKFRDRP